MDMWLITVLVMLCWSAKSICEKNPLAKQGMVASQRPSVIGQQATLRGCFHPRNSNFDYAIWWKGCNKDSIKLYQWAKNTKHGQTHKNFRDRNFTAYFNQTDGCHYLKWKPVPSDADCYIFTFWYPTFNGTSHPNPAQTRLVLAAPVFADILFTGTKLETSDCHTGPMSVLRASGPLDLICESYHENTKLNTYARVTLSNGTTITYQPSPIRFRVGTNVTVTCKAMYTFHNGQQSYLVTDESCIQVAFTGKQTADHTQGSTDEGRMDIVKFILYHTGITVALVLITGGIARIARKCVALIPWKCWASMRRSRGHASERLEGPSTDDP